MRFDKDKAVLMDKMKELSDTAAILGFVADQLPEKLRNIFAEFGDTAALAAEISAQVMTGGVERSAKVNGFVDANVGLDRNAIAQDTAMLEIITAQLAMKLRETFALMISRPGNSESEKVLRMLQQFQDLSRLMVLSQKGEKPFGLAWRKAGVPILPVGYRDKPQTAAARAIKGSENPVLCLWFQDLGLKLGTYALTAEVGKIATPELRDLALDVARAAIVIYMMQDKKTQQAIIAHPEQMLPLLKQYGVMSCVQIGKNGQLFVNIEALMSAYVIRQAVEKAA